MSIDPEYIDYYEQLERRYEFETDKLDKEERKRQKDIADKWLQGATKGSLYTFRFCVMDDLAVELRKSFDDYSTVFMADPTAALIFLGWRHRWPEGPRSAVFGNKSIW